MNMFKRMMALVLALIMVLSLVACGSTSSEATPDTKPAENPAANQGAESTAAGEFDPRSVTEGVTLTVAVPMDITVVDWETNAVTLAIQDALGVELEFEVYASADYTEKLNVMVNGGDELPDIIMGYSGSGSVNIGSSVAEWANQEALVDLTEYFENPDYAKYIRMAMEKENDWFIDRSRDYEGKIWAFSTYVGSPADSVPYDMLINAEFVKALGFEELPTTTEEFLELARAFKAAGDVNGNGKDDEVVLTGRGDNMRRFKSMMSSFEYAWGDNYLVDEDGELHFAYTTDEWKEGLKYVRTFFEEGLIDTGALTNDKNAYNSIVQDADPRVLADVYYWAFVGGENVGFEKQLQYEKPIVLSSPVKEEIEGHYDPVDPIATAVISADCENPLAAFLVLDYMCSEPISITNRYGAEGVNWDYWENVNEALLPEGKTKDMYSSRSADEYPVPYYVVYNRIWGGAEAQNVSYQGIGPGVAPAALYYGQALLNVAETEQDQYMIDYNKKFANSVAESYKIIPKAVVTDANLPMSPDELDDISDIKATLAKYVEESIAAFLTGLWDIDTDWDAYMTELEKIGVDEALTLYQTAYDRTAK